MALEVPKSAAMATSRSSRLPRRLTFCDSADCMPTWQIASSDQHCGRAREKRGTAFNSISIGVMGFNMSLTYKSSTVGRAARRMGYFICKGHAQRWLSGCTRENFSLFDFTFCFCWDILIVNQGARD